MADKFDFNIDFTGQGSNDQEINIFTPAPGSRRIPDAKYISPTGSFASSHLTTPVVSADRAGMDALVDQDHVGKEADLRLAIQGSLERDDGRDLDLKLEAAEFVLAEGVEARSVGEIFHKENYPEKDGSVATSVDTEVVKDDTKATILSNIGEDPEVTSFEEVYDKPDSIFSDYIKEVASVFDLENLADLATFLPEGSASRGILDTITRGSSLDLALDLGAREEIVSGLAQRLGEAVFPAFGLEKDASMRDVMEFLSFLPVDADAEIDIENAVKIVFSDDTIDGRLSRLGQWDTEFRAKYGDEGYTQLASFMVKEGIIDAASLALALRSPKLAGKLIADSKDKILTRLTKALGRASIMGLGGTGVQASMDHYLGLETDVPVELGARVAGAFVGEGVARVLANTGRGIFGIGSRLVGTGAKLFGSQGHRASAVGEQALVNSVKDIVPQNVHDFMLQDASIILGVPEEQIVKRSLADTVTEAASESNTIPYRDLGNQAVDNLRGHSQGSLGHIFDMTESEIQAGALDNTIKREIMLAGVGNKLIGETITKQTEVDNILNYTFDHGLRQVTRRQGKLKGDTSFFGIGELLAEARNIVGDIADDLFDALLNRDVYQNAVLSAEKAAFKGLAKPAKMEVITVREKMETLSSKDAKFIVTQEALDREGLSRTQQDSYWAVGKLLDFSAIVAETTMVQNAAKKGFRQLPDGKIVEIVGAQSDGIATGMTRVKEVGIGKPEFDAPTGDVGTVTRVLGYKKNFVPRRAKDADYLIGELDTKTGELKVGIASRYKGEVDKKITELDAELAGTGKVAFYFRSMTDEKSLNFGMSNNSMSLVDDLDNAAIQKIREALSATGRTDLKDVDMEQLRLAFDITTFGSVASQQIAGKRGSQGLRTVTGDAFEYKPGDEAITQHLMETSALQLRDFRMDAIHKFEKEFSSVLNPKLNWDQNITGDLGSADFTKRARSVQGFIRRNIFNDTVHGKEIRLAIDAWADGMRNAGGRSKAMVDSLEKMPIIGRAFKQTRDGTATFRAAASGLVFAGNMGSFITQVAPSAAMIAGLKGLTNPKHLAVGWNDFLSSLALRAGLPESMASKNAIASLKAIENSGLITRAEVTDLANVAYGQSSTIFNHAMFFVQKGEMANRANIWFTIRAEMMAKARKGELLSLNKNRVMAPDEIDSTEFSQIVSEKAKQIFLDTTQAGRLKLFSGFGAAFGQFLSPIIKTHTMWFAKGLSRSEKISASMGLMAFYGPSAIPFVASGFYMADKVGEAVTGGEEISDFTIATDIADNVAKEFINGVSELAGFSAEDKEFFTTAIKKGGVAALSGSEISLYHKMSIGLFLAESFERIEDPLDSLPMVAILNKAAESAGTLTEMLGDLYIAMTGDSTKEQRILDLRTFIGQATKTIGNALPGFGKLVDTLNNHPETRKYLNPETEDLDENGWITRSGKRIETDEPINNTQRMLNLFGIVPAPVQKNREVMTKQFDKVAILKKLKDTWVSRYKNAGTATARLQIRIDAKHEATEAETVLMATFQGALSNAVGRAGDARYRGGTLRKNWARKFDKVDAERLAGNRTRSTGE